MAEKCSRQLPPVRVTETLEIALLRMSNADDRKLSEYIRLVLERHVFGHAASLPRDDSVEGDGDAQQSNAHGRGGGA